MNNELNSLEDVVRSNEVISLEELQSVLAKTEPVSSVVIGRNGETQVSFTIPSDWAEGIKDIDGSSLTSCRITIRGNSYVLTKNAILGYCRMVGLSDRYASKCPANLLKSQLEHWVTTEAISTSGSARAIIVGEDRPKDSVRYVVGFSNPDLPVISNVKLLEAIKVVAQLGHATGQILVDSNVTNNYLHTDFRLFFPEKSFEVETYRDGEDVTETWCLGVHISNALVPNAKRLLSVSGMLYRLSPSKSIVLPEYSNLTMPKLTAEFSDEDIPNWAASMLGQVFALLPAEAVLLQDAAKFDVTGRMGVLATDFFRTTKIHRKIQASALDHLADSGTMTLYGLISSLGQAATESYTAIPYDVINHVSRSCGILLTRSDTICKTCGRFHLE